MLTSALCSDDVKCIEMYRKMTFDVRKWRHLVGFSPKSQVMSTWVTANVNPTPSVRVPVKLIMYSILFYSILYSIFFRLPSISVGGSRKMSRHFHNYRRNQKNSRNLIETCSNEFISGHQLDINKTNIFCNFGESPTRWRQTSFSYTFQYIWRHPNKVLTSAHMWRHS